MRFFLLGFVLLFSGCSYLEALRARLDPARPRGKSSPIVKRDVVKTLEVHEGEPALLRETPPLVEAEPAPPAPERSAPPPARKESPAPPKVDVRMHVVKKGETLQKIAKAYYGTHKAWPRIYEANRDRLQKADLILVGQVLAIP